MAATAGSEGPPVSEDEASPPAQVVRRAARYLEGHGIQSPDATAEALLLFVLGTERASLYARRSGLSTAEAKRYGRALCQRCKGTPLQYLTGKQPFMGLALSVEPGVFVPRPETEGLVEEAIRLLGGRRDPVVVDAGTGTGAVALAVKHLRPDATVFATDVSLAAVTLARSNAVHLGIPIDVRRGDLLEPVPAELVGAVDVLVSNPPYVTAEAYQSLPVEVRAEPYEALVGGTGVHSRLVDAAVRWLAPDGWLVVEIGDEQGPEVAGLFAEDLVEVDVLPDLAGRDRVVRGRRRLGPNG